MTRSDVGFPPYHIPPPGRSVCMHDMLFETNNFSDGDDGEVSLFILCHNADMDRSSRARDKNSKDIICLSALTTFHPHAKWNMSRFLSY